MMGYITDSKPMTAIMQTTPPVPLRVPMRMTMRRAPAEQKASRMGAETTARRAVPMNRQTVKVMRP